MQRRRQRRPRHRRYTARGMPPTVVLAVSLCLAACASHPSFDQAGNGSTIYLDALSEVAKTAARQQIVTALSQGVASYDLGIGDEVEVFFHLRQRPTAKPYLISSGDKLRIDFLSDTQTNQTVEVRPDGRVSLPLIGPVVAAGKTPEALAQQL
ncbi:MAG: polysaccharide biosynthesis/export family protein, partial [Thiohalocapsa sp.]